MNKYANETGGTLSITGRFIEACYFSIVYIVNICMCLLLLLPCLEMCCWGRRRYLDYTRIEPELLKLCCRLWSKATSPS